MACILLLPSLYPARMLQLRPAVRVEAGQRDDCLPAFLRTRPVYPPAPRLRYLEAYPLYIPIVQPASLRLSIPLQTQPVPPMNVNSDPNDVRTHQQ